MNRILLALWIGGVGLTLPGPAAARPCSLDALPAATLLLPYFEVDLQSP